MEAWGKFSQISACKTKQDGVSTLGMTTPLGYGLGVINDLGATEFLQEAAMDLNCNQKALCAYVFQRFRSIKQKGGHTRLFLEVPTGCGKGYVIAGIVSGFSMMNVCPFQKIKVVFSSKVHLDHEKGRYQLFEKFMASSKKVEIELCDSTEESVLNEPATTLVIVDEADRVLIDQKRPLVASYCVGLTATGVA